MAKRNRFGAACANCGVFVFPGGGLLEHSEYIGWLVTYPICEDLDRQADALDGEWKLLQLPPSVPAGCAQTVSVAVMGMRRTCWKCGEETVCVVGFLPARPSAAFDHGPRGDDSVGLTLARLLLLAAGQTRLAESIKVRYSRTMGAASVSNGCLHCGALQGAFPVGEELSALLASRGPGELDVLTTAEIPTLEWIAVLEHDNVGVPRHLRTP